MKFLNLSFLIIFLVPLAMLGESVYSLEHGSLTYSPYVFQPDTTDTTSADSLEEDEKKKGLPLKAERTISFTTNEGTWMSLDVSPDGETIAFDLLGDLYLMPAEGGKAETITDGVAFDSHPRFSPDGKYLLFISDRSGSENAYYMNLEDREDIHQVTDDNDDEMINADWSPDGDYIVVSRGRRYFKLWMYHKDGGKGIQLIKEPDNLKTIDPQFGHDGRYIYYSQRNGAWNYNAQLPQYQVGMYDRQTGERSTVTSRYGSGFTPTVSNDGKWMVYGSRYEDQTGLVLRNLESGYEQWLAYPVQRDDQESQATLGVLPGMAFTPDSKSLIAYYGGKLWRIPVDGGDALEIPFEVDVKLELGPLLSFDYPIEDNETFLATQIRDAVPSPDGKQLVFTALNKLYIQDLPDGEPRRLTDMDVTEAQPVWSPDGKRIAYIIWDNEEGGAIYSIEPNTRRPQPRKLTEEEGFYSNPAWSYNSDRIVFITGKKYDYQSNNSAFAFFFASDDLAWISTNGGKNNFIAKTDGRSNPHFIKSNDRIYLTGDDGELVSIRFDGTDEKKHAKITGPSTYGTTENSPSPADIITMAPEGDRALAQVNNNIYTVIIPQTGDVVPISVASPDKAEFPAKKLTVLGGEFPAWSGDASKVHWSLGKGHFIYDLNDAKAFEDSVRAAKKAEEDAKEEKENGDEEDPDESEENDEEKDKEDDKYRAKEVKIEIVVPKDIPEGRALLTGARIITMNGDEVIENGDILIEDNRIVEVGQNLNADGAEVIDVSGKTIMPGFIDTHAHMRPAWQIHKKEAWTYAANLAYGVTTTRDPQTGTTDVLTYADMVESGEIIGPRIYSTGPGVGFWGYKLTSLDHTREVLRQYSEYYNTKTIKMYRVGNRKHRQWIIMASKEQELMPTTEGSLNMRLNMTQLIDGYPGHEHNIPVHPLYNDFVKVTADAKMAVTATMLVAYGGPWAENYYYATERPYDDPKLQHFTPHEVLASSTRRRGFWSMKEEHVFQKHAEFMKDLVEAGGLAGIGSHGQLQGLGYHWELWANAAGGMTEHDALRTATILGAEAIGLEKDLGTIEAGKLADLVILDRNPLENLRNSNSVRYVMKNGRLYEGETLDEIYPRQKKAGSFWWKQEKPGTLLPGIKN